LLFQERSLIEIFVHPTCINTTSTLQYEIFRNLLLEVGYVGTRGQKLFRQVGINQARLASPTNPFTNAVTGAVITTNTPANAALRAPFQGVSINGFSKTKPRHSPATMRCKRA